MVTAGASSTQLTAAGRIINTSAVRNSFRCDFDIFGDFSRNCVHYIEIADIHVHVHVHVHAQCLTQCCYRSALDTDLSVLAAVSGPVNHRAPIYSTDNK